eukprot:1576231-Rhodomonas_salina.2
MMRCPIVNECMVLPVLLVAVERIPRPAYRVPAYRGRGQVSYALYLIAYLRRRRHTLSQTAHPATWHTISATDRVLPHSPGTESARHRAVSERFRSQPRRRGQIASTDPCRYPAHFYALLSSTHSLLDVMQRAVLTGIIAFPVDQPVSARDRELASAPAFRNSHGL